MNMDFFGRQHEAQQKTRWLVVWFVLAVLCMVALIYAATMALLQLGDDRTGWWHPEALAGIAVVTVGIVVLASLFKTGQLRSGGPTVALMLGGRPVDPGTTDPHERRLLNVVEEMAIASGVPVPQTFVLQGETGMNAFAAGWSSDDAAIAVTRGLLETLDRDELQGVIAHEFSHVFHGDMRLNIRLMGVLFGIVCIATIGQIVVRSVGRSGFRGGSGKNQGGAAGIIAFGFALMLIGWLGVFFARIIKAAVSRQREFLADAAAVQYTRNPRGIGMALAKIGGLPTQVENAHAEEASHMFFASGVRSWLGGLHATHPPIEQRVERVLPGFLRQLRTERDPVRAAAATPLPAAARGFAGGPVPARAPGTAQQQPKATTPGDLLAHVGDVQEQHVAAARDLLQALPLEVTAALREPSRAAALVLAMLLDRDRSKGDAQLAQLRTRNVAVAHDVALLRAEVHALPRGNALPLLELAAPALRRLPTTAQAQLRHDARLLAEHDGVLSPLEFALLKILERVLPQPGDALPAARRRPVQLHRHADEIAVVLSVLARVGSPGDDMAAGMAFTRGARELALPSQVSLRPAAECTIAALERAIDALTDTSPLGKANLLLACAVTVGADGRIEADEAELLRALAGYWGCPVPMVTSPSGVPLG